MASYLLLGQYFAKLDSEAKFFILTDVDITRGSWFERFDSERSAAIAVFRNIRYIEQNRHTGYNSSSH